MGILAHLKDILTVASILSLIMVGLLIALKSGVAVGVDRGTLVLRNLSQLVVSIAGCLLFLVMVQHVVGFRLGFH